MPNGYVYVFSNKHLPDLVKIGRTKYSPKKRAKKIGGTGVPGVWVVEFALWVENYGTVEKRVHDKLSHYRHDPNREFFKVSVEHAKAVIREVAGVPNRQSIPKDESRPIVGVKGRMGRFRVQCIALIVISLIALLLFTSFFSPLLGIVTAWFGGLLQEVYARLRFVYHLTIAILWGIVVVLFGRILVGVLVAVTNSSRHR